MTNFENNTHTGNYSQWVEGKIMTEGNTRLIENTLGLV